MCWSFFINFVYSYWCTSLPIYCLSIGIIFFRRTDNRAAREIYNSALAFLRKKTKCTRTQQKREKVCIKHALAFCWIASSPFEIFLWQVVPVTMFAIFLKSNKSIDSGWNRLPHLQNKNYIPLPLRKIFNFIAQARQRNYHPVLKLRAE